MRTAQLAELRWCAEQPAGAAGTASAANVLEAGIALLAPAPTAVAVRLTGINAAGAQRWLLGPLKRRGIDFEMIEVARTP